MNTIFVSGGGGPGMRGCGIVEIENGILVTKDIELGLSARLQLHAAHRRFEGLRRARGGRPAHRRVQNYLNLEKEPPPSASELIFELDAEGVTPIFTWGKTEGRVYFQSPMTKATAWGAADCE